MRDDVLLIFPIEPPLGPRQVGGKCREHGKLAGEGFRRSDSDLRSRVGRQEQIGFARHRAGRNIHHDRDALLLRAYVPQRQTFASMCLTISSRLGFAFLFKSAEAAMIIPEVQ